MVGQRLPDRFGIPGWLEAVDIGKDIVHVAIDLVRMYGVVHCQEDRPHQETAEVASAKPAVKHGVLFLEQPPGRDIRWDDLLGERGGSRVAPLQGVLVAMADQQCGESIGRVDAPYFRKDATADGFPCADE